MEEVEWSEVHGRGGSKCSGGGGRMQWRVVVHRGTVWWTEGSEGSCRGGKGSSEGQFDRGEKVKCG